MDVDNNDDYNDSIDNHDPDNNDHHYGASEEETIRIRKGTIQ